MNLYLKPGNFLLKKRYRQEKVAYLVLSIKERKVSH